jgi:hypothetical protein
MGEQGVGLDVFSHGDYIAGAGSKGVKCKVMMGGLLLAVINIGGIKSRSFR